MDNIIPESDKQFTLKNDSKKDDLTIKKIYEDMKKERIIWLEKAAKALESERK
jgi:hypothetical protein